MITNYTSASVCACAVVPLQQEKARVSLPSNKGRNIEEKQYFHWNKMDTPGKGWPCSQKMLHLLLVLLAEGGLYNSWDFFLYSRQSFPFPLNTNNLRQKKRRTPYSLHSSASHTYFLWSVSQTILRTEFVKKQKQTNKHPKGNKETPNTSLLEKRSV